MESTILLVEDDPQLREVLAEVLSDEGYNVYEAGDGQWALERIETIAPDLVLSDIRMPRLTGIELADRLHQRGDSIPIVLMSTSNNAPAGGNTMFLAKPFAIDDLVALVAGILRKDARSRNGRSKKVSFAL